MALLQTDRLRLCALGLGDAGFILRLVNEPSWLQHIGDRGVHDLDGARRYLREGPLAMYDRHGFGLYRIDLRETAEPIGLCGLLLRPGMAHADLGYALLPAFWGRGYAFEAAQAVLEYGRAVLGLHPVAAITGPDNHASIALLRKLGFRCEGPFQLPGDPAPLSLFLRD